MSGSVGPTRPDGIGSNLRGSTWTGCSGQAFGPRTHTYGARELVAASDKLPQKENKRPSVATPSSPSCTSAWASAGCSAHGGDGPVFGLLDQAMSRKCGATAVVPPVSVSSSTSACVCGSGSTPSAGAHTTDTSTSSSGSSPEAASTGGGVASGSVPVLSAARAISRPEVPGRAGPASPFNLFSFVLFAPSLPRSPPLRLICAWAEGVGLAHGRV